MNQNACLSHCRVCTKRQMDVQIGLVCSLTQAKPAFVDLCPNFVADAKEIGYYKEREQQVQATELEAENSGFFALEQKGVKKGVWGGVAMMVIAAIWFFGGLAAGYIFYYPPVLFLFGVYAVFKGLYTSNFTGQRNQ